MISTYKDVELNGKEFINGSLHGHTIEAKVSSQLTLDDALVFIGNLGTTGNITRANFICNELSTNIGGISCGYIRLGPEKLIIRYELDARVAPFFTSILQR